MQRDSSTTTSLCSQFDFWQLFYHVEIIYIYIYMEGERVINMPNNYTGDD